MSEGEGGPGGEEEGREMGTDRLSERKNRPRVQEGNHTFKRELRIQERGRERG